jgi:hypothetical protein
MDVPLYITETGWPTQDNKNGVDLYRAANYLAQSYILARSMPFVRGVWWYDFRNDGWVAEEEQHNFGMVWADLTPKPAFDAFRAVQEKLATAHFVRSVPGTDPKLRAFAFESADGTELWALWSAAPDELRQVRLHRDRTAAGNTLAIQGIGGAVLERRWGARWIGAPQEGAPNDPNSLDLTVGEQPIWISGDLRDVQLESIGVHRYTQGRAGKS